MDVFFWCSALFIVYTYALYPLAIWSLGRLRRQATPPRLPPEACPDVTVVIAVHNERHRVAAKIENLRSLDYPQDKVRVLFVSDGSTDGTEAEIARYPGIDVIAYTPRQGKAVALNTAMQQVNTPVVVFCDVRQKIDAAALRLVLARLMQPGIGVVSGELVHYDPDTHAAANIGLYWRYEKWIRQSESDWSSVVGATGAFYAMHRHAFVPLAKDTLLDDFEIPMQVARQGLRVQFEGGAQVFDELQQDMQGERKRKIRTLSGNFQSFARHPWLFSPSANPVLIQFLSHKVFRLVVPYAMVVALASSALSATPLVQAMAALQAAFYACALAGRLVPALGRNKLISFAGVFVELNWVAMLAGIQFWTGRSDIKWEKT
ncbi:MAG: glycosyltransferase family 2 protein [Rubrivivax sp.]|nr:MAG: glycosyltransferase family 2 protein [Rubrivivax sp.]